MAKYHGDIASYSNPAYRADNSKSLAIALLLLFFLGYLGAHRFYIGMTMSGLAQLVLSTMGILFTAIFVSATLAVILFVGLTVWLMIDFVLLLIMFR